jgi:hypothetical protein
MEVEISERARRILQRLRPAAEIGESIEAVTLDVLRMRLRQVAEEVGGFEARYGRTFDEFAAHWHAGKEPNRFSRAVERDFMEWEALTAEREELLELIRELGRPDAPASRPRDV